ncbi:MarR family transcriptional regulatory protein [Gloeobacter violaceus PCC 7421]|uniref:MarR family transcriptional regulatory protein n=1 Tax=Gloeobacter violaceus (strain ATCC 29082 / PCC 7421) TaxID=251221 RepID=Q7NCX1_GLOVI|nr:MarR family transcriptional regulatory protein [Gloeobacter violaceus PCC 7421]
MYSVLRDVAYRYAATDSQSIEAVLRLLEISDLTKERLKNTLEGYGVSIGEFTLMLLLFRSLRHGASPSYFADKTKFSRAEVTRLLKRLEQEGFVQREYQKTDKRVVLVRLLTKGQTLIEILLPQYYREIEKLFSNLSSGDRQRLGELVILITRGNA